MHRIPVCIAVALTLSGCAKNDQSRARPILPVAPRVVDANTELLVRTVEPIDTAEVVEGKSWAAVLARDVRTPEGTLIVGSGSPVYFGVARGSSGLQLVIRSIVAAGNAFVVSAPVTTAAAPVTTLDPWGSTATAREVRISGERITVPGQALLAVRVGEVIALR